MSQPKKELSFTPFEKKLVFSLALLQFTHVIDFMIMMPLGPLLIGAFEVTNKQFAYLVSGYTFSAGISALAASVVIDRFARKKALLFVYFGFLIGTLACALSDSYDLLLASRIVTGSFGGIISAMIYSVIGDVFPYAKRGSAMGVIMGAFSFAAVAGVPAGLYLANLWSWNAPFFMLVGLGILCFIYSLFAVPVTDQTASDHTFLALFQEKNHYAAYFITLTIVMAGFSMIPYISNYLIFNTVMNQERLPLVYLFGGATTLVTARLFGYLTDRFGKKQMFFFITSVSMLPIYLISHLDTAGTVTILAATTFFFIFVSGRLVPYMAMLTSSVQPKMRGSFMTVNTAIQQVSAAVATVIAGLIMTDQADNRIANYDIVSLFAIGSTILSLIFVTRLRIIDEGQTPLNGAPGAQGNEPDKAIVTTDSTGSR